MSFGVALKLIRAVVAVVQNALPTVSLGFTASVLPFTAFLRIPRGRTRGITASAGTW